MMKDRRHIEEIYDEHSKRLYSISLRIVANPYDAEEIMHDTLLQYCKFGHRSEIADLRKWLTTVCIRKSIDKLREKNRYKNLLDDYDERIVEVQEEEGEKENLQYSVKEVMEALFTLSDQYRLILSLHLFEGYDYQEISQITKMKENTIRSMYMRGRIKLREELKNKRK